MFNQFHDQSLDVTFIIPHETALDPQTLRLLAGRWKDAQKKQLLVKFKSTPGNEHWQGDENLLQEELLRAQFPPGASVTIEDVEPTAENLQTHPPLTTEA